MRSVLLICILLLPINSLSADEKEEVGLLAEHGKNKILFLSGEDLVLTKNLKFNNSFIITSQKEILDKVKSHFKLDRFTNLHTFNPNSNSKTSYQLSDIKKVYVLNENDVLLFGLLLTEESGKENEHLLHTVGVGVLNNGVSPFLSSKMVKATFKLSFKEYYEKYPDKDDYDYGKCDLENNPYIYSHKYNGSFTAIKAFCNAKKTKRNTNTHLRYNYSTLLYEEKIIKQQAIASDIDHDRYVGEVRMILNLNKTYSLIVFGLSNSECYDVLKYDKVDKRVVKTSGFKCLQYSH